MTNTTTSFLVGLGKHDMTAFIPGLGMMGYGQFHNTVKEVATPLQARAVFMRDEHGSQFVWVHLEQAFVTIALKQALVARLSAAYPTWQLTERNLLVTAQHTHSAPGGYSHYPFYNVTISGFQTRVFDKVCSAAFHAVEEAQRALAPAQLTWGEIEIPADRDVAFNRSMASYLNNADTPRLKLEEKALAVDRRMQGLFIRSAAGKLRGFVNWFAVHNTSVSSYNQRIHHDNKGVAAQLFEQANPGCIALFAQTSAGDVSPNFRWDKKRHLMVGKFDDQYESASYNGELQFRESQRIPESHVLHGPLESFQSYVDMATVAAAPAHGVGFFLGTLEGPGAPRALGPVFKLVARVSKGLHLWRHPEDKKFFEAHGKKDILLDHRKGNLAGIPLNVWKKLPPLPDQTAEAVRQSIKREAMNTLPWVPQIIPYQVVRLGQLLLVTLPGEITTHASHRLVKALEEELRGGEIKKILVTTYANGYMGYITTPEEYDLQAYEGGHTVYGRHTLDGVIVSCVELVRQLKTHTPEPSKTQAFQFPPDELARRTV